MNRGARILLFMPVVVLASCAEVSSLRSRVALQDEEIVRLRGENDRFNEAYYDINEQRAEETTSLREEIERLSRELEAALELKTDEERRLAQDLNVKRLETSAALREAEDTSELFERETTRFNELISDAESRESALQTRLKEIEETNAGNEQTIGQLRRELEAGQSTIESLEQDRDADKDKLSELRAEVDEAAKELSAERERIESANEEIDQLKAATENTQEGLAELDALRKENEDLRKAAESLAGKFTEAEEKLKKLELANQREDPILEKAAEEIAGRLGEVPGAESVYTVLDSRGLRIILPVGLAFDAGIVALTEEVKPILAEIAPVLKGLRGRRIRIEGHTDDRHARELLFADNWGLGTALADHVRLYLIRECKLGPQWVEVVSRAAHDPIVEGSSAESRNRNRRVEIVVGFLGG